jgi:hypothetical protein
METFANGIPYPEAIALVTQQECSLHPLTNILSYPLETEQIALFNFFQGDSMLDFFLNVDTTCINPDICNFDKTPTTAIIIFEVVVLLGSAIALLFLSRLKEKIGLRFLITAIGILIFELFTAPMWHNFRMGWWAYFYRDVSWILTIGWSAMILTVVLSVDQVLSQLAEWKRFLVYLAILMVLVSGLEILVVNLGIRSYAPEVLESSVNVFIAGVPLVDVLYYTPVFTGLVIGFYKYWSWSIDNILLIPVKQQKWWRNLLISFLAVFLFEIMVEPMVQNQNLPQWSYVFRDISILMTGLWILIVWIATNLIDQFLLSTNPTLRFLVTLLVTGIFALPLESLFILTGLRVYGPSAIANFTGILTPVTKIPVEVAFAIPCYMALVISFIEYWETLLDNHL